MATVFTHSFFAAFLGKAFFPGRMPVRFWMLVLLCAVLPDLDVLAFKVGLAYRHALGHRGFLHSLLFALIVGVTVTLAAFREERRFSRRWWLLAGCFSLVTASHGVLDAMTNGGYGTGFLLPFDPTRYFLPWRPLQVSPIGIKGLLSMQGVRIILNEMLWIWLPCLAACFVLRRLQDRTGPASGPRQMRSSGPSD